MTFLDPTAVAVAGALTIPPLIALYFLKLKRTVRLVPTTLLWKRSVEDLQVNSPFQRLRRSLLLLLQLLVLVAAAVALGKPMFQTSETYKDIVVILIDQSASMGVTEADGVTRLQKAKSLAKQRVDDLTAGARAMVIAFCDRATVVSSFTADKALLKRQIDSIEQTQSRSSLAEAMSLAEAYTQNITIGTEEAGSEIAPQSVAELASVFLFTDGRIEDSARVALQRFKAGDVRMITVGERADNVGIVAMDARRNYEVPELLEVTAAVQNFGHSPVAIDAILYVDGQSMDVQRAELEALHPGDDALPAEGPDGLSGDGVRVIAFDTVEFGGGGVVEVALRVDDALPADDQAWTIIEPWRHLRVLLVTEGNIFLENVLGTLPLTLQRMKGKEYEEADERLLMEDGRSSFDLVISDRHSTGRLPRGNYFFWGAVPQIEGVSAGGVVNDQVIFNWDETHPILRHVAIETLQVYEWLELRLPREAVSLVDGETSAVLAYLTRDASQFLISAFGVIVEDESGSPLMNTYWVTSVDFVVFMQNAVQYLASNVAAAGKKGVTPGAPLALSVPQGRRDVQVHRPDGVVDRIAVGGQPTVHYARTRHVGTYRIEPGVAGDEIFAVNLFNPVESDVGPERRLTISSEVVESQAAAAKVNRPAWQYLLLAMLFLLFIEWVIYNKRVFV